MSGVLKPVPEGEIDVSQECSASSLTAKAAKALVLFNNKWYYERKKGNSNYSVENVSRTICILGVPFPGNCLKRLVSKNLNFSVGQKFTAMSLIMSFVRRPN